MNDLNQISEVFAGLLNIYILPSDGVTFDDIIESELQGINLLAGIDYIKIPFTVNSADFKGKSNISKIAYFNNGIEMLLHGNNLDQVQEFASMDGNTYILLFEDRFNNFWVSGTPELPLRFEDKYTTGKALAGANARKLLFGSDSNIMLLSTPKPIQLTYGNPKFYVTESSVTFELRSFSSTASGTVIARTSDNVEHSVYLDNTAGYQDLVINNIPGDGIIEFISGMEFVWGIRVLTEQGIILIINMSGFYKLSSLQIDNNAGLTSINLDDIQSLSSVRLAYCSLISIVLPQSNTVTLLDLQQNPLSSIDLSKVPKLTNLTLRPGFTDIDVSPLLIDSFSAIVLLNNSLSQSVVDKVISDILDRVIVSGVAGTLNIASNSPPSAQGLIDINTLEVTYGWTITHD